MSEKSFNEEKNNKDKNETVTPQKIQDELACVIHTSISNIATQVNNLNKYVEETSKNLSKEVDQISVRLHALQDNVVQVTNNISNKDTNQNDSIECTEFEKGSEITNTPTKTENIVKPLSTSLYKTQDDVSVQTSPTHSEDVSKALNNYHNNMYACETCKEIFIPEIKENQEKLNQEEYLDDLNSCKDMPPDRMPQNQVPVDPTHATCGDLKKPEESSLVPTNQFTEIVPNNQFTEISKITRAAENVLCNPALLKSKDSVILITSKYVRYGTGTREIQFQPEFHHTTEVFIGPAAPPSPPLPSNWLDLLRVSVMSNPPVEPSSNMTFLGVSPAELRSDCIETIPEADFETLSAEEDSSLTTSKPEYKKSVCDPVKKDQEVQFPSVPSSPAISNKDKTPVIPNSVSPCIQPSKTSIQHSRSPCVQQSKTSITPRSKSPCVQPSKTSVISRSKSPCVQPSKTSVTARSKSPSVQPSKTLINPRSKSPCVQPSRTPVTARSKSSCVQPSKTSVTPRSKSPCVQPSKTSVTPRSKSPCVQPSKTSVTPRSKSPCVQPSKTSVTPRTKSPCIQPSKTSVTPRSKSPGVQQSKTSVTPRSKSPCVQPSKTSVTPRSKSPKLPVSKPQGRSFISIPVSSQPIPREHQHVSVAKSETSKPIHSTQQISSTSVVYPSSSYSCPSMSILPTTVPVSQSKTIPITASRFSDIPSSTSSSETSFTPSAPGDLKPPQQSSGVKPTAPFSLLSLLPFSSSSVSNPQGQSVFQPSPSPASQRVKQAPSIPILSKAKCALLEVVRKSVPLPKADDQSALKSKGDMTENAKSPDMSNQIN
ncbi:uncharacterized protein RHO17_004295 isoform 1-T6 [Thomomys bottae]